MARRSRGPAEPHVGTDIIDTSQQSRGSSFRLVMAVLFLVLVSGMLIVKWNGEMSIAAAVQPVDRGAHPMESALDEYYRLLRRERADRAAPVDGGSESAAELRARRRQQKQAAKEAFEDFQRRYDSGECDAECRESSSAVQLSYNQISSVVDEDYYKLLGVSKHVGKSEIKQRYADLKQRIEAADDSAEGMDLQEVREAYGVLMNPEARMYYNLYGLRPPAYMKLNSQIARDPGWGPDLETGAWKWKKLLAVLSYADSKALDLTVLAAIALLSVVPVLLDMRGLLRRLQEVYPELRGDCADRMERAERLRAEGERSAAARPGRSGRRA
eukprot:TRINITY_DN544_c0_g2_i1.p1 TRINITY_DN544_c0_g2~~TRINITY_DN544_c0_g2_i1.p1  ORF type:complete len:328 (+),score=103.36 TRINITY_DN544_c0_g2_i1:66-1049(+)